MAGSKRPARFEPTGGYRPVPSQAERLESARTKNLKVGLWSVGAIALVAFSMAWNPPTRGIHSFTEASDYVTSKDSGCTNSGEGCHGAESSYTDFNDYHPETECTSCHEFQGVGCIPCHSPSGHECQSCHDGTMPGAGDQTRITDAYPKGHYRETTHTATATDMKAVVRAAEGGDAGAECLACHSRDLYESHQDVPVVEGSPYEESVGCGECHNDTRAFGLEQVLSDWKGRGCEDCHREGSSSPVHDLEIASSIESTGGPGCGETGRGCHDDTNVHSLHANAPEDCSGAAKDGEPICHDLEREAHKPEATTCGRGGDACHAAYENDTYSHKRDRTAHDAGVGLAAGFLVDDLTESRTRCNACHGPDLTAEHGRPNSALRSSDLCEACHGHSEQTAIAIADDWPSRRTAGQCDDCHGNGGIPRAHGGIDDEHDGVTLLPDGEKNADACGGSLCHSTTDVRALHAEPGCLTKGCHGTAGDINGSSDLTCGGTKGDGGCHSGYSRTDGHGTEEAHRGVELAADGQPVRGACAALGCHTSIDLAQIHGRDCDTAGCHVGSTPPASRSCGGLDATVACHSGFSATEHFADHDADRTGTVNGVTYRAGENTGCFGCHNADLITEHTGVSGSAITGGGASPCRVCHDDTADPGNGEYAGLSGVKGAIARRDARCIACHASGSDKPNASMASSAHKRVSTESRLPAGYVWADPFAEWKAAFESPMGGGHNVLSAATVGASVTRLFPLTEYTTGTVTFRWPLPANSGDTRWLKPLDGEELDTLDKIRHADIDCDDCHSSTAAMVGPQGAAVKVRIDPAYSQTEYANPSRGLSSQFAATGTDRVICMKCHNLSPGSVEGTDTPGGHPVHAQHASHEYAPVYHPLRYGAKCIDCHVRIPHASRSPRLLVRTVPGEGRPADEFPYVEKDHEGLAGVRLADLVDPEDMTKATCVTNGCHGFHSGENHPEPSDVPTATYWP